MFGWFKRKSPAVTESGSLGSQVPGEIFRWPKGAVLTAVDDVLLAIPNALLEPDKPIKEFLFGSDEMEINLPSGGDVFLIRLRPGMSISLAKSVESYIVADDKRPRRFWVKSSPPPPPV